MSKRILAFVRFFKEQGHRDMFLRGELYMNRLKFFKRYEEQTEGNIGDKHEAVSHWLQPEEVTISLEDPRTGEVIKIEGISDPVPVQYLMFDEYHVYCLFAVYFDEDERFENLEDMKLKILPDVRAGDLGSFCSIIEAESFIQRLDKVLPETGVNVGRGLVEYFDPGTFNGSFNGQDAILRKKSSFAHQREYRIFTYNRTIGDEPRVLQIGDLSDITFNCHKSELAKVMVLDEKPTNNSTT
ncbi:hypothetical protein G7009_26990 [Pseudomonas capeferrum]|jgi:hypothetical protein|uniref:hypothetical protein n=1 Tax=Pseudomonas capeferrum TaxID=1495066 RepID=UPI0015E3947B|nr:hypothetical protein [Pseudomonas capeferrum]MBA1205356.1 hypothetical protein [Pseudomonas capeferrum]